MRAAWPIPQFNAATNIFFPERIIEKFREAKLKKILPQLLP